MPQEYYIRQPDSEDARGPFTVDKLASLVEADQVSRETLFYDEEAEQWVAIEEDEVLKNQVFPEKTRLSLRKKTGADMDLLNASDEEIAAVSVDEMLAAAEGDTEETRHVKERVRTQAKAASLSIPAIGFIMLISAFNNLFPNFQIVFDVISDEKYMLLLENPLLLVGLLDLILAVILFLSVSEIFPFLRFRAMLGLGYYGFFHWAEWINGDANSMFLMICAIAGSIGVFVCTLTLSLRLMVTCALAGILGMGGYTFFTFFA